MRSTTPRALPKRQVSDVPESSRPVVTFTDDGLVLVSDSANPWGEQLAFTVDEWNFFLAGVKAGEFDPQESSP